MNRGKNLFPKKNDQPNQTILDAINKMQGYLQNIDSTIQKNREKCEVFAKKPMPQHLN
jgi:hypothetical protein